MIDTIESTMELLKKMCGTWVGAGRATFPTTADFDYRERFKIDAVDSRHYLFYEQRTEAREAGQQEWKPSHHEVGFFRVVAPMTIEQTNAQGNGRMELLRHRLVPLEDGLRLEGETANTLNDARMLSAKRTIEVHGNQLRYELTMATTAVQKSTPHLAATLTREGT